jgi:hypothetical protein
MGAVMSLVKRIVDDSNRRDRHFRFVAECLRRYFAGGSEHD